MLFTADKDVLLAYPNAKTDITYVIPDSVKTIGEKAFSECSYLQQVSLPQGILEIEKYAFSGCTGLQEIAIPDSVERIGTFAFSNCSTLKRVTIGRNIASLPAYIFNNCSNLDSVVIPEQLQTIGSKAFAKCGTIEEIQIPNTVTQISDDAFVDTTPKRVRFYSTSLKEQYSILFPRSEIICLCKDEHTYTSDNLIDCSICDYATDTSIPPQIVSVTHDTVQLAVNPAFEYSYDLVNWTSNGLFTNLEPNHTYQFYARVIGDYSGNVSLPCEVTTDRAQQPKAVAPIIHAAGVNSIPLQMVSGCEYSIDGVNWQSSPVFSGLSVNTSYTFYQRYAQTQTHHAGAISDPTVSRTAGVTSLSSSVYAIQNGLIRKIPAGTTVQKLLQSLVGGEYCIFLKDNAQQSANAIVGTGMIVRLQSGGVITDYNLLVTGDTNGDGDITITDMIAVKAHILEKKLLTSVYAQAADTSGDSSITITDFIQIKAKILGKGTITAR